MARVLVKNRVIPIFKLCYIWALTSALFMQEDKISEVLIPTGALSQNVINNCPHSTPSVIPMAYEMDWVPK